MKQFAQSLPTMFNVGVGAFASSVSQTSGLASLVAQPLLDAQISELGQQIPKLLAEHAIPGLAIGICDRSGPRWLAAFGSTSKKGAPVTTDTMFSVQSISKLYTATIIMLAVQEGLVELDRPITTYLPAFTVNSVFESHPEERVTLRHLLSHTAGFTHEAPEGSNYRVGRRSFTAHCRSISETWLRFPVGHHFEYSNLGVDLAGFVLQEVIGRPFPDVARDLLFQPAGLRRTTFDHRAVGAEPDRATGHHRKGVRYPALRVPMVAAGGLYTSVTDACQFLQLHLAGGAPLLATGLVSQMYSPPFSGPGQELGYGLGVAVVEMGDRVALGHSGGGFGFLSDAYWLPDVGVGVVVVTNSADHPLQFDLARRVLLGLAGESHRSRQEPSSAPGPKTEAVPEPSALRIAGTYIGRAGKVALAVEDGHLVMVRDEHKERLRLARPDRLVLTEHPAESYRLLPDREGETRYLQELRSGLVWYRNKMTQPSSPGGRRRWARFVGEYQVRASGRSVGVARLEVTNRHLALDWRGSGPLFLDEKAPGIFFSCTGEALDLAREPPTYGNIPLTRQR